jgi:prevent-host-death family protein
MSGVNILKAKSSLSKLVAQVEQGLAPEVVLARNGRPVARIVPLESPRRLRIGLAKGRFKAPADLDDVNPEVAALFGLPG